MSTHRMPSRGAGFAAAVVLLLAGFVNGQQSSSLLSAYGQQGAPTESQLRKYLADRQKQADADKAGKAADTSAPGDASAPVVDSMAFKDRSAYEDMIRGVYVDPDKILRSLEVFGHNVFAKPRPANLSLGDQLSVPAGYPIGSGDEIVVVLWGRLNEEYRMRVDRDGKINIPHIGLISVAGMSFGAMQKTVLERTQSIEGVQASVTMGELRSIQVYIMGDIKSPGLYTVGALSNVTNALFSAGGPTKNGSLRMIQLKRNGVTVSKIDFYDFLMSGENNTEVRLQSGDVILVPVAQKMAAIAGNVRRSALYELKGKTTLADLIALAGGVTPAAWVNRIQLERFNQNQFQTVLDLKVESADKLPKFEIQDGDVVKIFPIVVRDKDAVYLSGNVLRPGKYEFRDGMRVSSIVNGYEALQSETYLDYAIIKRQEPPRYVETILPFNLKAVLEDSGSAQNLALRERDEIVIYNRNFFEPDRNVYIGGAVNNPGRQKLIENMTIRDLIIQAGGLKEDASGQRGELYRRKGEGEKISTEKRDFCVQCALSNDPGHNLRLEKSDRVIVRRKEGWAEEKRVWLGGEFAYAGEYVLMQNESLGELITRAGGFTTDAYLPGAVLTRNSVKEHDRKQMDDYARQLESDIMKLSTELASQDKTAEAQALLSQETALLEQLKKTKPVGRVVVDLTKPRSYAGFRLEDGDSLYVPRGMSTVTVMGEVFNPATFQLDEHDRSAQSYVEAAGGYKEYADQKNVYVVKASGSVVTNRKVNVKRHALEPGDVVVVPQKIRYGGAYKTFVDSMDGVLKLVTIAALVTTMARK